MEKVMLRRHGDRHTRRLIIALLAVVLAAVACTTALNGQEVSDTVEIQVFGALASVDYVCPDTVYAGQELACTLGPARDNAGNAVPARFRAVSTNEDVIEVTVTTHSRDSATVSLLPTGISGRVRIIFSAIPVTMTFGAVNLLTGQYYELPGDTIPDNLPDNTLRLCAYLTAGGEKLTRNSLDCPFAVPVRDFDWTAGTPSVLDIYDEGLDIPVGGGGDTGIREAALPLGELTLDVADGLRIFHP